MRVKLHIKTIEAQKDEYQSMRGTDFDATPFEVSTDRRAEVVYFKRFVVKGQVEGDGGIWDMTILISLRADLVRITVAKDCPFDAHAVFVALDSVVSRYLPNHLRNGNGARRPLQPVELTTGSRKVTCTTPSGWWLADTLHHIREDGGVVSDTARPGLRSG